MPEHRRLTDGLLQQRQLFQKAPGFIAVLRGPEHVFEFVNEAYERVIGARDYIGKPLREAVPEAQSQGFVDILDQVYRTATRHVARQTRIVLQRSTGTPPEERYLDFIYEPMVNSAGKAAAIFVEGFDVTSRYRAESALRQMNRSLEAEVARKTKERDRVWTNSRDPLVIMDTDGALRAVSPAWTCVLGHAADEVVGRSFFNFVHPDDTSLTRSALNAAAAASDPTNFEIRHVRDDATMRWISWHTSVEDGLVYAFGRDITAERQSAQNLRLAQSRLRAIFETTYLFQGLLTPEGVLLDANKTALSAIGKTLDEVVGQLFWMTPWFTSTPGLPESVESGVRAAARGSVVRQEIRVDLPVGGWRWFDFSLRPVFDRLAAVVGIVPEALELTDRKQAEEALHQSQKLDAMGQITGGLAHDFNNLLLPIVGSLDLLHRRGVGGEREQRLVGNALKSAERAKLLVQRLLAFARRQPLRPVAVCIGNLIEEISALIASTTGPQIAVVVEIEEGLPAAKADPTQLEMAILNLSVNARDAMPDGGSLRISATRHVIDLPHHTSLKPGQYICLSVADTGYGMDSPTLARAIEPFFSTKGIGKGTGLGLSMVHGLASQLGGALVIGSKPDLGTNVELWLPVSADSVETVPASAPARAAPTVAGTALLVDDEEMIRVSTADMLNELGFAVIEASSAREALGILRRGEPIDILITDHLMPGMTGVDLAQTATAERPHLPVLIVSGFAEVDALPAHLPRLPKPFRQADLAAVVLDLVATAKPSPN